MSRKQKTTDEKIQQLKIRKKDLEKRAKGFHSGGSDRMMPEAQKYLQDELRKTKRALKIWKKRKRAQKKSRKE